MSEAKTYTYDEALDAAKRYFGGDALAAKVWLDKYALRDGTGCLYECTPADMHRRIAREIARAEGRYPHAMTEEEVYRLLDHFKYIVPSGGPMAGIGNSRQTMSLSNYFVIGTEGDADSYGAVMRTDEEEVQLMKRRGGVGHDLSGLRPAGMAVANSALVSTGVLPFMERYSNSAREVGQRGRRGALMLTLSVRHPDVAAFIGAKMTAGKVTGANVSVRVDDAFMRAVINNEQYVQQFPTDSDSPQVRRETSARALWKTLVHNAWSCAEPGVLFWDTIIRESVADCYADNGFRTVSTNPCGEIPLCAYDSCRLLALNLYSYVNKPFTDDATFDFDLFRQHAYAAQRIMDDIVDLETEKIDAIIAKVRSDPQDEDVKSVELHLWERIRAKTVAGRRTGTGVTAEGDMLAAMGLRYGSEEATAFAVNVHRTLALAVYRSSTDMARDRGPFPLYDATKETDNPFIRRIKDADEALYNDMTRYGRRNIACLTIAPTGTVSMMTQTTGGIEPVFLPVYTRRRKVSATDNTAHVDYVDDSGDAYEEHTVYHRPFVTWMATQGYDTHKRYTAAETAEMVSHSPYHKATADDVDWLAKVRMQGAIQQWVDHSIAVTVNLPASADEALVDKLYIEAWRAGCKGCTIYRDGSRDGILIPPPADNDASRTTATDTAYHRPEVTEVRPQTLECDVVRFQNNKEKWVAFVGLLDGHPYEIFTGLQDDDEGIVLPKSVTKGKIIKNIGENGHSRYDFQFENKRGYKTTVEGLSEKFNPEYWNYAKLISGVLRYRMPIEHVIKLVASLQLKSENINTWKNGVERALKKYVTDGTEAHGRRCPVCGHETLVYQEGCLICQNCGATRCE